MEADKAYLDTMLWLPKSVYGPSTQRGLRSALTLQPRDRGRPLQLWEETQTHLGVPRAWDQIQLVPGLELVDRTSAHHKRIRVESRIELDAQYPDLHVQRDAVANLINARGGLLHVSCGWGKTVIMLECLARWKVPALIINNRPHILQQWKEELAEHLDLDEEVGWVQGPPKKWKWRPVTLAMLNTLALHHDKVPETIRKYFGVVIFDETNHLGARSFSRVSSMFHGKRFGVTATVDRADGFELVYLWGLGPILYQYLSQELTPQARIVRSPTRLDLSDPEVRRAIQDRTGEVHHARLCAHLGSLPGEVYLARQLVDRAMAAGRDVLAISVSKEHARALHALYPQTSAILDGEVKAGQRLDDLRTHTLSFATVECTYEALNKKSLDTLILLTEVSSESRLTQAVGRILRYHKGKKPPLVIVLLHHNVPEMQRSGRQILRLFKEWNLAITVIDPGKKGSVRDETVAQGCR